MNVMMGMAVFPGASPGGTGIYGAGQEYMGTQVAAMGDAWYSVYGPSFDGRVVVLMAGQFAPYQGQAFMEAAMNTPDWTSRAYTHHVGAFAYAPYWYWTQGAAKPDDLNADCVRILATPKPLDTLFGLAYTNTVDGYTYASIAPTGYIGINRLAIPAFLARLADQPWGEAAAARVRVGRWHRVGRHARRLVDAGAGVPAGPALRAAVLRP